MVLGSQLIKMNEDLNAPSPKRRRIEETRGHSKSCYYEPVEPESIRSPKNVPLNEEEEKTVAQCGIEDGDTLHLLLSSGNAEIEVSIYCYIKMPHLTPGIMTVPTSKLILHLKEEIKAHIRCFLSDNKCRSFIKRPQLLVLKNNDIGMMKLEDTKILGDYHKDNTCLGVHAPSYDLSFLVPTYAKMKRVLFEPYNYTIRQFRNDLQQKIKTEVKMPAKLYGAVKHPDGSLSYLLIHKDHKQMTLLQNSYISEFLLLDDYTLTDIYKMIDQEHIPFWRVPSTLADCTFDEVWIREFAPQIEAEATPMGGYKALRLFYFPVHDKVVSIVGPISSMGKLQAVKAKVCEIEGVEARNRIFIHESDGDRTELRGQQSKFLRYHYLFESNPTIRLLKQCKWGLPKKCTIKVYVEWSSGKRSVPVKVPPNDTISIFKDLIEDAIMVPRPMQKLTFCGRIIEDNATLLGVGIKHNSTVELSSLWQE